MEIAPSLLGANLLDLGNEIRKCELAGIHMLHFDHMDGHFVPNISFGPAFVKAVREKTKLFLDVHLMLSDPLRYIDVYAQAGADRITIHQEIENPMEALCAIKEKGLQAGLAIKPATSPTEVIPYFNLLDQILVMTVEPGFGGQLLREDCVSKLPVLKGIIKNASHNIVLEVDGGIKLSNAEHVIRAGAECLVMGTGFFQSEHPEQIVRSLMLGADDCD